MNHFGELTDRMHNFREELLNAKSMVSVERARLTTESYKEHADKPMVLRRALCLENILKNMTIFIEDNSIIAGNQAESNRSAPIFPEYAMDWVIDELDEFEKREGDIFYITEESKNVLREIAPFWEHKTLKDRGLAGMPAESRIFYDLGIIKAEGNITSGDAHIAVNYETVLNLGLINYKERTEKKLKELDLTDYRNLNKSYFYRAILIVLDAVAAFAKRYADLALELAEKESDVNRKEELLEMSRILNKVPYYPAETFHEAVQSLWIIHLVLQIESNGHSLSYGRMDQYLNPFYEKDLKLGKITEDSATELLTNLWLKTFTINKIRSWSHTRFSAGSPLYQNVTVGGQTVDKKDAVNPLSYLILKSVAQTKLPQPNLTVRYHKGLSDDFMKECIEVVRLGFGMPAFNSDEVIIPSFIEKGVDEKDAYNYSAIGCVEVAVPGKWGYRCTGMSFLNFPKSLLIALNDGVDPESGTKLCEGVGHFKDMTTFDEVMKAWDKIIREFTRHSVIIDNCADLAIEEVTADVLCSALTDDCIERGLNLKEGGAVYDFISDLQVGIANLGDSLAAIKKCVFEDKSFTASELWDALINNFEGEEGKRIQEILINDAPKYGNDDDYIDLLLREAYEIYIDEVKKHKNTRYGRGPIGGCYYAGTSSISANVPQGAGTLATPDGRKAGEPLAEGCSPSHAMDKNGPTAVFKSVSKLPTRDITGGVLLNQKVTPQMLTKEEDRLKLISLIRVFFNRLEGFHVQYNVVSRETLLDAQKNPEKYRDLIVRVAGYSAFFNVLSKQTQDDIIERTEQVL
ncbi:glycyl radical protein [Clostridium beijerinckii]|uniref:glycyl radical protein n=1 Tax=Clostridium beijerinckii TaxID=1520 RepID=UPI001361221F|nr:glycyl radical protein [Clostridium beijerinckii]MZK52683.1 formate C-acetyltransferase/glycerol dehydratase family glycyl radical enzyme [Clostridium beijerinckii]MZK60765.1 formate C-acetyltransferase/glycerol dehydratase family glycyl radical enzyme [Clostridium beijerinckii]MZK70996.1 formate C-acetyltransferase/glycerol dehydratase family glycyl radical enzyme [Clostridium beijerinckii]MZK76351.1 formate C-acetyltransferase/glycerol dehydratase family glycyl radical enzyme [Clostridium 